MKSKFLILIIVVPLIAASCNKSSDTQSNQNPPPAPPPVVQPTPEPTPEPTATPTPTTQPQPQPQPTPNPPEPAPAPTPPVQQTQSFTITANDTVATPSMVTVNKGDKVNLTVKVSTSGTYEFGLEFRGGGIISGPILPGQTKSFSFTANSDIILKAFWPQTDTEKQAQIMVHVNP